MPPVDDLLNTPVLGPWVKFRQGEEERRQQVYLSLVHWFEAAKFMPHQPQLRDELLFCPTIKEARKFARRRQDLWRSDWQLTRQSVLVAGMGLLCLQRPEMGLRDCPLGDLNSALSPLKLPQRFVDGCLERFEAWRHAPRVAVFGADIAPSDTVGLKLSKLITPGPTWTLITGCHRNARWKVHDWALSNYAPVQYVGSATDRASRHLSARLVAASDHVVVFEQRRQKRFDYVLQIAKASKKRLSLELYDGPADAATQLRFS